MEALGRYILSVTAAAIIFGILQSLFDKKGSPGALMRLIGGLFLAFTVISPVAELNLNTAFEMPWDYAQQGSAAAFQGEEIAQEQLEGIIKERCRTYILDKARDYQAQLEVEVTLTQDEIPVPAAVRLQGSISPYAKSALQQWLEEDMGIRRENQIWIG